MNTIIQAMAERMWNVNTANTKWRGKPPLWADMPDGIQKLYYDMAYAAFKVVQKRQGEFLQEAAYPLQELRTFITGRGLKSGHRCIKGEAMPNKPNQIKPAPVAVLLILMPLLAPLYLIGALASLITVTVYCGFKNTETFFMEGLGFESTEQTIERVIEEKLK